MFSGVRASQSPLHDSVPLLGRSVDDVISLLAVKSGLGQFACGDQFLPSLGIIVKASHASTHQTQWQDSKEDLAPLLKVVLESLLGICLWHVGSQCRKHLRNAGGDYILNAFLDVLLGDVGANAQCRAQDPGLDVGEHLAG